jgi:hypothetical protein
MQYHKADFLHNYTTALEHDDTESLRDLFIDKISDLIAHHKAELLAGLRRLKVALPPNMSTQDLIVYITEVLHADKPNLPVLNLLGTMILVKDGAPVAGFQNDAASEGGVEGPPANLVAAPAAGATSPTPSASSKLNGDQVSGVVGSIMPALTGIFNFAKSALENKKKKKATGDALATAVDSKTKTAAPPADTTTDKKKKSNTGMYVAAFFVTVLLVSGGIWYYKTQTSGATGSTGASGAVGA